VPDSYSTFAPYKSSTWGGCWTISAMPAFPHRLKFLDMTDLYWVANTSYCHQTAAHTQQCRDPILYASVLLQQPSCRRNTNIVKYPFCRCLKSHKSDACVQYLNCTCPLLANTMRKTDQEHKWTHKFNMKILFKSKGKKPQASGGKQLHYVGEFTNLRRLVI
jgi:hypothetical protein